MIGNPFLRSGTEFTFAPYGDKLRPPRVTHDSHDPPPQRKGVWVVAENGDGWDVSRNGRAVRYSMPSKDDAVSMVRSHRKFRDSDRIVLSTKLSAL